MENTMIGDGGAEGPAAAALNPHEHRGNRWLDFDHFPNGELEADHSSDKAGVTEGQGTEDNGAEDKCQKTGYIEDKTGPGGAKDCQVEDGSQEVDYKVKGAEDEPGDEDGVDHRGDDVIVDQEMDAIEVDCDRSPSKDGHSVGICGGAEGWWFLRAFFV